MQNRDTWGGDFTIFTGYVWLDEIKDMRLRRKLDRVIARIVRKRLDAVENYAQFVIRKLQSFGILTEYSTNVEPVKDGFKVVIECRVRAVDLERLSKNVRYLGREVRFPE